MRMSVTPTGGRPPPRSPSARLFGGAEQVTTGDAEEYRHIVPGDIVGCPEKLDSRSPFVGRKRPPSFGHAIADAQVRHFIYDTETPKARAGLLGPWFTPHTGQGVLTNSTRGRALRRTLREHRLDDGLKLVLGETLSLPDATQLADVIRLVDLALQQRSNVRAVFAFAGAADTQAGVCFQGAADDFGHRHGLVEQASVGTLLQQIDKCAEPLTAR